ncbi:MAG TPA: hypothetical protein VD846_07955 [Allosphingosinicella sp.]|nr:hypothetical protein [Allosphingosinicella sp.]
MSNQLLLLAATAGLGAVLQEFLYWYNLRHRLDEAEYRKLIRSPGYWMVVALWIIIAAVLAMLYFEGRLEATKWDALLFGVGLPLFIKQLGKAQTGTDTLGSGAASYFRLG